MFCTYATAEQQKSWMGKLFVLKHPIVFFIRELYKWWTMFDSSIYR